MYILVIIRIIYIFLKFLDECHPRISGNWRDWYTLLRALFFQVGDTLVIRCCKRIRLDQNTRERGGYKRENYRAGSLSTWTLFPNCLHILTKSIKILPSLLTVIGYELTISSPTVVFSGMPLKSVPERNTKEKN